MLRYTFEWDQVKARENLRKHRISFDRAAEVFLDPLAVSIFDEEHSEMEERWVTIGRDPRGGCWCSFILSLKSHSRNGRCESFRPERPPNVRPGNMREK
jgi:uncharacterized DUF497 family protein